MEGDDRDPEVTVKRHRYSCFIIFTYNANCKTATTAPVNTVLLNIMNMILLAHNSVTALFIDKISSRFTHNDLRVDRGFPSPFDGMSSAIPKEHESEDNEEDAPYSVK
jgi:hypothetical protein